MRVRESNKTMGETTNGGHEFDPGGTHNQYSPKQSGRYQTDMQRLRSKIRDGMTGRWDVRNFEELSTASSTCLYLGTEKVGCVLSVP